LVLTGQPGTRAAIAPNFSEACAIELPERISTERPGAMRRASSQAATASAMRLNSP
jgi:hypothetical protein